MAWSQAWTSESDGSSRAKRLLHEPERLVLVEFDERLGDRLQLSHGASSATG